MRAAEYYRFKKNLIPDIMAADRRLDAAYDIIVIEGAGSPAEMWRSSGRDWVSWKN